MIELNGCPVCESTDVRDDYEAPTTRGQDDKTWRIAACRACSLGFMNPQPTWDELAPYYSDDYEPYSEHHTDDALDEKALAECRRTGELRHVRIAPGARVLDVGCAAGGFLRLAQKLGAEVQGVEPSKVAAERARKSGIEVADGTLEEFVAGPGKDRQFDIITANHVLEHAPKPVHTLATMRSVLAPGGVIWICVPNAECFFNKRNRGLWDSVDVPYHLMQFNAASLREAGRLAGLRPRREYTLSFPPGVAGSMRQWLRKSYKIPRRLTQYMPGFGSRVAPWFAQVLDDLGSGEALVSEFVAA